MLITMMVSHLYPYVKTSPKYTLQIYTVTIERLYLAKTCFILRSLLKIEICYILSLPKIKSFQELRGRESSNAILRRLDLIQ